MFRSALVISFGASIGAILRWQLGARFNSWWPTVPLGTLLSNLIGGYIVGLMVGWLSTHANLSPEWRLLVVTGFCGGLTTFSTFSAEVVTHLQQGRLNWALGMILIHVTGSLLMTIAGVMTSQWLNAAT
jgi:CrcB protein